MAKKVTGRKTEVGRIDTGDRAEALRKARRALHALVKKHSDAIAKHRNVLRDEIEDAEAIIESCDDALRELRGAMDTLSQYL